MHRNLVVSLLLVLSAVSAAFGADVNDSGLAALQANVQSAQSAGDNAWMLVSSALVLMMTGPGLALFYGGLVRKKNVLGTMMQSFVLMAVVTVLWALVGYSLAFGEGSPFIGGLQYALLDGVGAAPNPDYAGNDSAADVHDLPVDVCDHHAGADQRRVRGAHEVQRDAAVHGAVVPARLLPDGAHGVGQGRPAERVPGREDSRVSISRAGRWCTSLRAFPRWFARSISASAKAIRSEAMKPHNLVLSFIGACLLWVGWFGFNAGSALAASGAGDERLCGDALRRRLRGARLDRSRSGSGPASPACSARFRAPSQAWWRSRRPRASSSPFPALFIGFAAGMVCYFMVTKVKSRFPV